MTMILSPAHRQRTNRFTFRRWHQSPTIAAVITAVFLLLAASACISLFFYGTWYQIKTPSTSYSSFPLQFLPNTTSTVAAPSSKNSDELSLDHIFFGIASSTHLWKRRRDFLRLWWRPREMRGYVWLEKQLSEDNDGSLPPIMVSEDVSGLHYPKPIHRPSGLRISRIISETFRLELQSVRWFVLCDDDTIFNVENLILILKKYDSSEMVYIGSTSESHSANSYFSHSMAFGGGGIAISYPLAEVLSEMLDDCLGRYPKLYGSDDRLHACITELGVPLSREPGFHQWDIRGNAHGLLSAHPIAPFISMHHVEAIDPFFPGLSSLEGLKLLIRAMRVEPQSFLQRSICYDRRKRLTFSVSLGYVVQVFPTIILPRELDRSEQTFSAWNGIYSRNEFDLDTKDVYKSVCKKPVLFFLKDVGRNGQMSLSSYKRTNGKDDFKRNVFCFPRTLTLGSVYIFNVSVYPLSDNWHLVPRRLCCKVNQTTDEVVDLMIGQCSKGTSALVSASM